MIATEVDTPFAPASRTAAKKWQVEVGVAEARASGFAKVVNAIAEAGIENTAAAATAVPGPHTDAKDWPALWGMHRSRSQCATGTSRATNVPNPPLLLAEISFLGSIMFPWVLFSVVCAFVCS